MIFGGFAVNLYGFTRVTEDLDIWIDPASEILISSKALLLVLGFLRRNTLFHLLCFSI
jgi:hypothetical protein